ncbi:hypothetical protein ACC727_37470, partial [Rhizobium johnstonii]
LRYAGTERLGTGLLGGKTQGVFWKDMGVVNLRSGKPTMLLSGGAALILESLLPAGHKTTTDQKKTHLNPHHKQ